MKTDRKNIESFIIKMKFCGVCIDFFWFISLILVLSTRNTVKHLYHLDFWISNAMVSWFASKYIAITHALLLPLRPVGRSFIHGTSFNISHDLTKISYVNKRLPKTTIIERKNESTKRNKKLSSSFYLAVFLSLVYMCVRVIHMIVWVDLDNSNKLNGMQSL